MEESHRRHCIAVALTNRNYSDRDGESLVCRTANLTQATTCAQQSVPQNRLINSSSPAGFGIAIAQNIDLQWTQLVGFALGSSDLLILPAILGDASLDIQVDTVDFNHLIANFGRREVALGAIVPEPALLLPGMAGIAVGRRARSRK